MTQQKGIIGVVIAIVVGLFMLTIYNGNQKKSVSVDYDKKIQTAQIRLQSIDLDLSSDFYIDGTKEEKAERRAELKTEKALLLARIAKWQKHEDATDVALVQPKPKAPVTPGQPKLATKSGEKTDNLKKLGGF